TPRRTARDGLTRRAAAARLGALTAGVAFAGLPIVAGEAHAYPRGRRAANKTFGVIARLWLDTMLRASPVNATQIGDHRFDARLDDVSNWARQASVAQAKMLLTELRKVPRADLSQGNRVDAALLENELSAQIWRAETVQDWAWNPLGYQNIAGGAVYNLMARDFAPVAVRLDAAAARMALMPTFFEQVRAALDPARVPAPHAETYAAQNAGLKSLVGEMIEPHKGALTPAARANLDAATAIYLKAIDEQQAWIEKTLLPAAKGDFRAGAAVFDAQLKYTLQSDLTRADIRARAEAAITSVRGEMYAIARQVLAGRADAPALPETPTPAEQQAAIRAAIELAAADRPARGRLVETSTEATEIARKFVIAKDLITLPEGPVRVILMPEFQRGFAVAYCDSPGPLDRHLDTFYAVSPIPDDWTDAQATSFLREYNTRGIQDIAVHEAMPGHYVQIFHANGYPSVLRAVLASGSFVEGWAVYAEQMMVEQGFKAEDPLYKLTQLKVQLRTITNALIDQAIHCDGMTRDEMMRLLTETAFQEEREAAGKWRRAQLSVTQLSTYFVGYLEHMETRAEAMRRQGAAFNLKAYHNGVLAFGSPPMKYARALYLGDEVV
ncbi:MAG: DUF885 family protein, partial [Alphaproteobacteria bacterium]|nr:DUF885 family protein [Alphaproteobacteria bacterium]